MSIITDGTGTGKVAKVDNENRLHTHAFTVNINQSAAMRGESFQAGTGVINLTSDNESAIFYFKNTSDIDILMYEQFLDLGTSTGGTGSSTITYYVQATSGTIISTATVSLPNNRRLTDATVLDALVYKGAEGATLGGGNITAFVSAGFVNQSPTVFPSGVSLGVSITPPTSNTSMNVTFGINIIANATNYAND